MPEITIKYQPFRFLKYKKTVRGSFPDTFSELKPVQFLAIARLINGSISETDFLKIMTSVPKFYIKRTSDFDRYHLMELFTPFTEIKPYDNFLIPKISFFNKVFCAPKFRMGRVTFGQFIFVESYFTDYQNDNKNTLALHKFVASLYLRKDHVFNEQEIALNAAVFSKAKPEVLQAVVINYVLIKEWIAQSYPMIFQTEPEPEENSETPKKTHKKPGNSQWIKILENIIGEDLVNHDRYTLLPLHNVLRWMTKRIVDNMKRK